ncbi:GNAT family N-acetyltransferase [Cryptosporangium sp. NPDC048952]|uniref:GNAT family N-acetyltransferase n=1 Tax=Cryptosporangium sp. NPDC048952 TaxID=3363961 RepID=UPI003720D654
MVVAQPGDENVAAAIELGRKARKTLGFLPDGAYKDAAANRTLLAVRLQDDVVGYAYFGLSAGRIRLNHLCVDPAFRGHGIARLLVEEISKRHADYAGVLAKCRYDYGLGPMWIRLGFTQVAESRGRSAEGHPLITWWRDHGHPDLFSRAEDDVFVRAAIDMNVLRDLAQADRSNTSESRALLADQVADRLGLVRTAALDAEIDSIEGSLRAACITQAQRLPRINAEPAQADAVRSALVAGAQQTQPGYPQSPQDRFDLEHLTEAISGNVNVFVTYDTALTRTLGTTATHEYGLRIMRPSDVVIHIDELARAEAYRPGALMDTHFQRQLLGVGRDAELVGLRNNTEGERPGDLQRRLRALAQAGHERVGITGPDGSLIAAFVVVKEAFALQVPLLRVRSHPLADTLARQLLFLLRSEARQASLPVLQLTDPHISSPVRLAAETDGFIHADDHRYAFVLDLCADAADVEHAAVRAAAAANLAPPVSLVAGMSALPAASMERAWWPAKLSDSDLPSYLISIRQAYSSDLLGIPPGLLPRSDALGISREHVYYRAPTGPLLRAPARVLWYMSAGGKTTPYEPAVIACSQVDAVLTGEADDLHSRFQHLGVWNLTQVHQAAKDGQVQAIRFTNTEILPKPIVLTKLRAIGAELNHHVVPQGPLRISNRLFQRLYEEGR